MSEMRRIIYEGQTYRIKLKKCGKGGNAIVYSIVECDPLIKVLPDFSSSKYVIKWLNKKRNREMEMRFQNEIKAMVKLKSLDVCVPIFAYNLNDYWYIMPEMKALKDSHLFNKTQLIELLICLAEKLKTIHSNGYAHRDIKPSNILLDDNDIPFWADLGLVKHDELGALTPLNRKIGARGYIANEVGVPSIMEDKGVVSYQIADIKSFSKLILAMFSDSDPFEGLYFQYVRALIGKNDMDTINPILNCIANGCSVIPENRLSIDEIIHELKRFRDFIHHDCSENEKQVMKFEREIRSFISKEKPSYEIYDSNDAINKFLNMLSTSIKYEFNIKVGSEQYLCNYLDIDANMDVFCFEYRKGNRKDKFFFSPIAIRVSRDGICIIETGSCQSSYKIQQQYADPFENKSAVLIFENIDIEIVYQNLNDSWE